MTSVQGQTDSGQHLAAGSADDCPSAAFPPAPPRPERAELERRPGGGSAAVAAPGLVTSAITVRENETAGQGFDLAALWSPSFPRSEDVAKAVQDFTAVPRWNGHEGPRPRFVIGAGAVRLEAPNMAKRERALERELRRRQVDAEILAAWYTAEERFPADAEPTREITGWSRKSRSNMIYTLAVLDWSPLLSATGIPAMSTLTYPGDWYTVAPDGKTSKGHLRAFFKRYERAWGVEWIGVWKMEFQKRGAVHYHLYSVPPPGRAGDVRRAQHAAELAAWQAAKDAGHNVGRKPYYRRVPGDGLPYREWLSLVWAEIVNHPDPEQFQNHLKAGTAVDYAEGMRTSDPKRLALYFAKHGTYSAKEYQHTVPEEWREPGKGPGRFWGYRGKSLKPLTAAVEIDWDEYQLISRTLRRLSRRAQIWDPTTGRHRWVKAMRQVKVPRGIKVDTETGEVTYRQMRTVRRPVQRFSRTSGFLCVNDGPAMARILSRLRETCLD